MQLPAEVSSFRVPCASCGAQMAFSPEHQQLACTHCGQQEALPLTREKLWERPLSEGAPTGAVVREQRVFACPNCGARTTTTTDAPTITCAFCGTRNVNPDAQKQRLIEPAGVLPFRVSQPQALAAFKRWIGEDWLAPSDLKAGAALDNLRGVYVPFWTFDAQADSDWWGEAGHYYYVAVSVPDGKGGTVQRQEQRVRWESRSGTHAAFYDDVLEAASQQLAQQAADVAEVAHYNLADVVDYDPRFLLGWEAEVYSIDLPDSTRRAEEQIRHREEQACAGLVGGNVQRNLRVSTRLSRQSFKHLLLPLWVCAYVYKGKTYRFFINGQSGRVAGHRPKSAGKIALLVVGFLLLVVLLYAWSQR